MWVLIFKIDFFNSSRGGLGGGYISTADEEGWEMVEHANTTSVISSLNMLKHDKMAAWLRVCFSELQISLSLPRSLSNTVRCCVCYSTVCGGRMIENLPLRDIKSLIKMKMTFKDHDRFILIITTLCSTGRQNNICSCIKTLTIGSVIEHQDFIIIW